MKASPVRWAAWVGSAVLLASLLPVIPLVPPSARSQSATPLWAWGRNGDDGGTGALGDGTTADRLTPVQVVGLTGVTGFAAGIYAHSVAVKSDGTVWTWGRNDFG